MNWILLVMGAILSVVAAVIAGGLLLPATYEAQRVMLLRASPETVRKAVRQAADWPVWMSLTRTPQVHEATERVTLALLTDDQQVASRVELQLKADGTGTRVTAVDRGRVSNPVARLLRHYVTGPYTTLDATLRGLAESLGEPAEFIGS